MKHKIKLPLAIKKHVQYHLENYNGYKTALAWAGEDKYDVFHIMCSNTISDVDGYLATAEGETKELLQRVHMNRNKLPVDIAAEMVGISKSKAYYLLEEAYINLAQRMGYIKTA